MNNKNYNNHLLGIAFDAKDKHKRITKADDFTLVGGCEETHEKMSQTIIKTSEDLKRKGRSISTAEPKEIIDLIQKHKVD